MARRKEQTPQEVESSQMGRKNARAWQGKAVNDYLTIAHNGEIRKEHNPPPGRRTQTHTPPWRAMGGMGQGRPPGRRENPNAEEVRQEVLSWAEEELPHL